MIGLPESRATFYGEYKTGLLSKKRKVSLTIFDEYIYSTGARFYEKDFVEVSAKILFEGITLVEEKYIDGKKCLCIDYLDLDSLLTRQEIKTILFPCLEKHDEAVTILLDIYHVFKAQRDAAKKAEQMEQEKHRLEELRYQEDCERFFKDCYAFHIENDNNPFYPLQNDRLQFAGIYIDQNKNLNFLKIDGSAQEESNACIPYGKIHYYEKAGSVHYTTDINANYSNFGGSITGATISKNASIVGGLLLGPMGMAAGALLSHKPSNIELPSNAFNITSDVHKIDDRSVILNYYSDKMQQLMDIELPPDIYNFLQTYLPEKKYGIVLELEKEVALQTFENKKAISANNQSLAIADAEEDTFTQKAKKLKILFDNGILTQEEFEREKQRLLNEI